MQKRSLYSYVCLRLETIGVEGRVHTPGWGERNQAVMSLRSLPDSYEDLLTRGEAARLLAAGVWLLWCAWMLVAPAQAQSLRTPARIAEGPPGRLVVTDYGQAAIFVVDKRTLAITWQIALKGRPLGVASVGDLILVGNEESQAVEVYEIGQKGPNARYVLGSPSNRKQGQGDFPRAADIAVDPALGLVFILDTERQRVYICEVSGSCGFDFAPVDSNQRLLLPAGIAVDTVRREILVTDHGDPSGAGGSVLPARIHFYGYSGRYLRQVSGDGRVDGVGTISDLQFARPQGIAVDGSGHILLVDSVLGRLFIFDENNPLDADSLALAGKLGGFGSQPGELDFPIDLVVDGNSGDVFVTNSGNNRIEVFPAAVSVP